MSAAAAGRAIPAVARPRPMRVPQVGQRRLANGLNVVVARRSGIPRFELRLRIPTVRNGRAVAGARQLLLADSLLCGTSELTSVEIAEAAQRLGGSLSASADAEWVVVGGSALSVSLRPFLELMGEVVRSAAFPAEEVSLARERMVHEIALARSQPETIARDALLGRLFDGHAYGRGTPTPESVAAVRAAALREDHAARLLPPGSVLVLVGDVAPPRALDAIESALGGWGRRSGRGRGGGNSTGRRPVPDLLAPPKVAGARPMLIVDRPGALQTNVRLAGTAVPRDHADSPALVLANAIFGGYFTSRLVDNIRERRGYTYSPRSAVEHRQVVSAFTVSADVGTDVTAAALVEIFYELGRMVTTRVDQAELDAARRYLQGTLAMSIQTQAGLTSTLATLTTFGLGTEYLRDYPRMLEAVTVEAVQDVSVRYLAPAGLLTVLVGDCGVIESGVEAVGEVELSRGSS